MGALLEEDLEERTRDRPELKGKRSRGLVAIPGPGARSLGSAGAVPGVFVVGEGVFNHCIGGCT